jgi:hypothetical protein
MCPDHHSGPILAEYAGFAEYLLDHSTRGLAIKRTGDIVEDDPFLVSIERSSNCLSLSAIWFQQWTSIVLGQNSRFVAFGHH